MPSTIATPLWRVLREFDKAVPLSSTNASIVEVYDYASREVLILGEPGAGKTTLLLELTRALLKRARQDDEYPIPVVFFLSSWVTKRQPLAEWFVSELQSLYQVSPRTARFWIEKDQILPLLVPVIVPIIVGFIKLNPIRIDWSWKRALRVAACFGLVFGWFITFIIFIVLDFSATGWFVFSVLLLSSLAALITGLRIKLNPTCMDWSWKRAWQGVLIVIYLPALSFASGLVGPFIALFLGFSRNTVESDTFIRPNEGIWRSLRNSIRSATIVMFISLRLRIHR